MSKLIFTLFVLCFQRIYCDDEGYGGGGGYSGGYSEPSKVEKASFGMTVDMEKEETYLKKDPGQLVLVLGDNGPKKSEYGGGSKKKEYGGGDYHGSGGGYKGGSDYQGGGGYKGGDDYQGGGGYKGGDDYHGGGGYGGISYEDSSSYGGGGYGDSGYGGKGYGDSGYGGSSYGSSGYGGGGDHGYSGDGGYMSGGYSKGGGGGGYGGAKVQYKSVYMDDGYGSGNGLVVSTGKYVKPGDNGGGHGMPGGYSSRRFGIQRNPKQQNRRNYGKRPANDLSYASDMTHNQYSSYIRSDEFIPNDRQYYYYNN